MGARGVPGDQVRVCRAAQGVALNQRAAASPEELLDLLVAFGFGRGLAGVPELYALASDGLRGKLGALQVFERAFGNDLYLPLLQHDELRAGQPVVIGGSARAELIAVRSGEVAAFQLGMVRNRRGAHEGLWSLSGVFREGVDL